ncbi:MAG: CHAD domain-containing protein [Candidatus Poribacteria bacterium]|nr:CHAD domain-containing protein [Candidatus Poribacteria bacterium]
MDRQLTFRLPDGYDERRITGELENHHFIRKEESTAASFAIYDTFDWRLFHQSLVLHVSEGDLILYRLPELTVVQRAKITNPPVFAWDFPEGELKMLLAPIIEVRALMKLAEIHSQSTAYRILNQDEKTVVRFNYEETRSAHQPEAPILPDHLCVKPIKGYGKYYRKLVSRLVEMGCTTIRPDKIYFKALETVGKKPGEYSAKLRPQLDPDMRAAEATKVILRFLLKVIKSNEHGIKADLDTEFLHDFRVAIRRTRAALSQIKSVFPAETTDRFRRDFSLLGKLSNPLRDLDVYLLKEKVYKAMAPATFRGDIEPLFDFLRERRLKALEDVINGLDSEQYSEILKDWETFLNEPPDNALTASHADMPVIDLAQRRIYKKYRRVVKTGNRILGNAQDKQLHELRIECKKLRYLMEFFSSLFPNDKISILIKQLKKLQDNLGDFNDFRVQKEYLENIADEFPVTDQQSRRTILAMGSLIGTLDKESQIVKSSFSEIFTGFVSPSNRRLYVELFAVEKARTAL